MKETWFLLSLHWELRRVSLYFKIIRKGLPLTSKGWWLYRRAADECVCSDSPHSDGSEGKRGGYLPCLGGTLSFTCGRTTGNHVSVLGLTPGQAPPFMGNPCRDRHLQANELVPRCEEPDTVSPAVDSCGDIYFSPGHGQEGKAPLLKGWGERGADPYLTLQFQLRIKSKQDKSILKHERVPS